MSIEINLPPLLQTLADGAKQVDVSGSNVGECLKALVKRHPLLKERIFTGDGKISKGLNIYVNGEGVHPDVPGTQVKDGDKIHLAYLIFGG